MRILRARLQTAAATLGVLERFYGRELGLARVADSSALAFRAGATVVELEPVDDGRPFSHFALRVPRNRFAAAREWLGRSAELLPDRASGETTFRFESWNAEACYALDPGDNIVELIAHRELPDESPDGGPFDASELLGVCELGLVGPDPRAMAAALEPLGIGLWDGTVDEPGRLAFMGGRDGVLILSQPGRGWLPTGRPAEVHPVEADVAGPSHAEVQLPGARHRVRTTATA